jgi:NAD(P)-dependent dehydrogenase (short-subunit alcohol dehydrogenase family)
VGLPADVMNKRILVVGASSGIGRELARQLAANGALVAAAARRADRLAALPNVIPVRCDVTVPATADTAVATAVGGLGGLDALVYAAGLSQINPLHEASYDDWVRLYATNLFGAALLTKSALPHLLAEGSESRAVYLTSDAAEMPYPGMVLYSSAKTALSAFTRGLAGEVRSLKVTEVVVGPTAGTDVATHLNPESFEQWLPRWFDEGYIRYAMMQPEDVAAIIVDLLAAELPPALVRATGAPSSPTIETAREVAGNDQPAVGSAITEDRV